MGTAHLPPAGEIQILLGYSSAGGRAAYPRYRICPPFLAKVELPAYELVNASDLSLAGAVSFAEYATCSAKTNSCRCSKSVTFCIVSCSDFKAPRSLSTRAFSCDDDMPVSGVDS
eukprot:4508417-Prymnesium_polylepis.2